MNIIEESQVKRQSIWEEEVKEEETESLEEEPIHNWDPINFSNKLIIEANENIQRIYNEKGPFNYLPLPKPDSVWREFIRNKTLEDETQYEGECND